MRILVGTPSYDTTEAPFELTLNEAIKLPGAYVELYRMRKSSAPAARNVMAEYALEHNFDYVFFMDVDMVFPPNALQTLVRAGKDIVGGLYCMARDGFTPCAYKLTPEGNYGVMWLRSNAGVHELDAIGTGCLLINTTVFKRMSRPWFYYAPTGEGSKLFTEDFTFCRNAKVAGYKIWVEPAVRCGHIGKAVVTPDDTDVPSVKYAFI